jgi:hypothetical protein
MLEAPGLHALCKKSRSREGEAPDESSTSFHAERNCQMAEARGLWLCCGSRASLDGKKGSHPFFGIGLPPRLARDPSALPSFRKFISAFALDGLRLVQIPKVICAKFRTTRTGSNVAAFAQPACADFDSISCPASFATALNGRIIRGVRSGTDLLQRRCAHKLIIAQLALLANLLQAPHH